MFLLDLNVRWQIVQQWRGKGNKATVEMTSGRQSLSLFSNNATTMLRKYPQRLIKSPSKRPKSMY